MPKKYFIDDEEKQLIEAYQAGDFAETSDSNSLKNMLMQTAKNYSKKEARINIRISESDLQGIKIKAAEEGLPYQTLISSVLHKFVNGRLA